MTSDYDELKKLIESDSNKEEQCKKYLIKLENYLFRDKLINKIKIDIEYRGNSGDSDIIISGITEDDLGTQYNEAFIWEAKAPQCFIFKKDNENRLKPSDDLVKAENQLLHYYLDQKNNQQFLNDFKIQDPKNVKIGGIIIGSSNTKIERKSEIPHQRHESLFDKMFDTRKLLYKSENIKLAHWDTILDQFKLLQPSCPTSKDMIEMPQEKMPEGSINLLIKLNVNHL